MNSYKKIWELQHTTICKVLGMALDLQDLRKISRKFNLLFKHPWVDEEFALHSAIVGLCGKESSISRHVQKLIGKRFSKYAARLSKNNTDQVIENILNGTQISGIPLWAILWHLAMDSSPSSVQGETALFEKLHMLEHSLLKDFWNNPQEEREKEEARLKEEIHTLRSEVLTLQATSNKLQNENSRLRVRLNTSEVSRNNSKPVAVAIDSKVSRKHHEKTENLKFLLEEARKRNQGLLEECRHSRMQIESLMQELIAQNEHCRDSEKKENDVCSFRLEHCLRGKRIAMIGGIDSLECHYRNLVEKSGGEFCRHDGRCCRGKQKLEECIQTADLVICPTSVTSHFAADGLKKVCKKHGIRWCFIESAGLGSLRNALVQHFGSNENFCSESEEFEHAPPKAQAPDVSIQ